MRGYVSKRRQKRKNPLHPYFVDNSDLWDLWKNPHLNSMIAHDQRGIRYLIANPNAGPPTIWSHTWPTATSSSITTSTYSVATTNTIDLDDWGTATMSNLMITHEDRKQWANISIHQDAQDKYCDAIGRIRIEKGYDLKIDLPDGRQIQIDDDGGARILGEHIEINRTKYKISELPNGQLAIELPNGLYLTTDDTGQFLMTGELFGKAGVVRIKPGLVNKLELPDGSYIDIDATGIATLFAANRQRRYRATPPGQEEFNEFLNGSDLLQKFIQFLDTRGLTQSQALDAPVELFINWLLIEAAKKDQEEPPVPEVDSRNFIPQATTPRCQHCQSPIPAKMVAAGIHFCSGAHMDAFMAARDLSPSLPMVALHVNARALPARFAAPVCHDGREGRAYGQNANADPSLMAARLSPY